MNRPRIGGFACACQTQSDIKGKGLIGWQEHHNEGNEADEIVVVEIVRGINQLDISKEQEESD